MSQISLHISTNSYMFRHQGAVFRKFITNKGLYVQHALQLPVAPTFVIKMKSLVMLKFQTTRVNKYSPYCCNNSIIQ